MISCYGCNKSIDDMYYLLAGEQFYWHFNCLKCASCAIILNEQSKCYLANGKFYCSQHYYAIKSNESSNKENFEYAQQQLSARINSCKHCNQLIKSDDYVIRLKSSSSSLTTSLYHLNCFVCKQCNKRITPGELYGHIQAANNTELIFCNQHYYEQMYNPKNQFESTNETDILLNSTNQDNLSQYSINNTIDLNNNKTTNKEISTKKNITNKRNNNKSENDQSKMNRNIGQQQSVSRETSQQSSVKRKRYRTSFKHQQLGVLKQYFQMNPNPDSKDLTILSKRTGLQNRVLQVWFQNARAKQRKSSGTNPNEPTTTMAKNFYSSILETDLNTLNKSSLDEGDEEEDDDEIDEDEDDEDTNNDEDDNEHLTSVNDMNQQSITQQQIIVQQNQHDMFNNQQNLCYF